MNDAKVSWNAVRSLMSEVTEAVANAGAVADRIPWAHAFPQRWADLSVEWPATSGLAHSMQDSLEKMSRAVDRASVSMSRTLDVAFVLLPGFERDVALREGDLDLAP